MCWAAHVHSRSVQGNWTKKNHRYCHSQQHSNEFWFPLHVFSNLCSLDARTSGLVIGQTLRESLTDGVLLGHDFSECTLSRSDRLIHIFLIVRGGKECRLKLRRGQVNSSIQHGTEKFTKCLRVALRR